MTKDFAKLDWSLLRQNGCPKCGDELITIDIGKQCGTCSFTISKEKVQEIIDDRGGEL